MPLHPLHALFVLEVFAFLYLVETRRLSSVFQASLVHGIVAFGILLGALALQVGAPSQGNGIAEGLSAAFVAAGLALVVVVSWVVAALLSRRHRREMAPTSA